MEFNPYSIPLLLSMLGIFSVGTLAYRYNPRSPINKTFLGYCLSLCFWLACYSLMYNSASEPLALLFAKIGFLGVLGIPLSAYVFVYTLLGIQPIPHIKKLIVFSVLSIPLLSTPLIYEGMKSCPWGFYPVAGPLYILYAVSFALLSLECVRILFIHMKRIGKANNLNKYQEIKHVLIAFVIANTGVVDFIAKYPVNIYPSAWLSALVFICLISYAILRHQILENQLLRQEVLHTEKLKAVATLASGLVHEIRNPLTALQTFNDHLPQKGNDPAFLEKFHTIASTEIERINTLLSDLLVFAKPSLPQMQSVNPNQIIQNLLAMLDQKIIKSKISLNTNFESTAPVNADPNHLKQALLNLILNAIDAMPNGGQLTVDTGAENNCFIIRISDTGVGIKPDDIKQIFDPFFTNKEKGTGLGLSITLGIIEKHGGKIAVESILNQGTTFTIYLPI